MKRAWTLYVVCLAMLPGFHPDAFAGKGGSGGSSYGGGSSRSGGSSFGGSSSRSGGSSFGGSSKSGGSSFGGSSKSGGSSFGGSSKSGGSSFGGSSKSGGSFGGGSSKSSPPTSSGSKGFSNPSKPSTPSYGGSAKKNDSAPKAPAPSHSGMGGNGNDSGNKKTAGGFFGGGNNDKSGGSDKNKNTNPSNNGNGGHKQTKTADGGYLEDRGNHVIKYDAKGNKEYMKSDSKTVHYGSDGAVKKVEKAPATVTPTPATPKSPAPSYSSQPRKESAPPVLNANSGHKQTKTADGGTIEDRGNHVVKYRADGTPEYMKSGSKTVQYRKDGSVAQTQKGKAITTHNADGSYSVQNGNRSYTQKTVQVNQKQVVQRTYVRENRTVVHHYDSYSRGGYVYHSYVPVVTYDPWFYGYALHPWHPISYRWGFLYDPWYTPYGYYYHPYTTYYGPSYWLTDYLIADSLRSHANRASAEANRAEAAALRAEQVARNAQVNPIPVDTGKPAEITDEMKADIRSQVEEIIRAHERKEAVSLVDMLRDADKIFVVADDVDVLKEGTEESCSLTAGDLIRNREKLGDNDQMVKMIVVSAKKGSCKAGTKVLVSLIDLQEMHNAFAERLEEGMEKLKAQKPDEQAK